MAHTPARHLLIPTLIAGTVVCSSWQASAEAENVPAAESSPAPRRNAIGTTELLGLLERGTLPTWSGGVEAAFSMRRGWAGGRVMGVILRDARSSEVAAAGDFSLTAGVLSICGFPSNNGGVALCAGAEVGQLGAAGIRFSAPRTGRALWFAPRGDISWAISIAWGLALVARGGLATPLKRTDFILGDWGSVHRPDPVVWRLGFGARWDWL